LRNLREQTEGLFRDWDDLEKLRGEKMRRQQKVEGVLAQYRQKIRQRRILYLILSLLGGLALLILVLCCC